MKMPSTEALDIAVEWLQANEGVGQEGEACKAVAAWIEHEERERKIRRVARLAGLPIAAVRRRLAER